MSHYIDFGSHGKALDWNGHWMYPEYLWKLIGKEYINRQPYSRHIQELARNNMLILDQKVARTNDGISRKHLARHWQELITDGDLSIYGLSIQAQKPFR